MRRGFRDIGISRNNAIGVTENLMDALLEIQAISRATQCQKYLYSLSLDPPKGADISDELYLNASDRAESHLGLDGQARWHPRVSGYSQRFQLLHHRTDR